MNPRPLLAALLLAGSLLAPATARVMAADDEEEIEIEADGEMSDWGFSPATRTVPVGTTVTWKNTGDQAHSVTSRDHLFDSRLLDEGDSWSHTFEAPGTYRYFCVPYPWMKGTIVVTDDEDDDRGSRRADNSRQNGSGSSSGQGSTAQSGGS